MFTYYNTVTSSYKLDKVELANLCNDYKEYCNENKLDYTEYDNFFNFDPVSWISKLIVADETIEDDSNDYDLFVEMMDVNNKQEIRNKITELKAQIIKLENML